MPACRRSNVENAHKLLRPTKKYFPLLRLKRKMGVQQSTQVAVRPPAASLIQPARPPGITNFLPNFESLGKTLVPSRPLGITNFLPNFKSLGKNLVPPTRMPQSTIKESKALQQAWLVTKNNLYDSIMLMDDKKHFLNVNECIDKLKPITQAEDFKHTEEDVKNVFLNFLVRRLQKIPDYHTESFETHEKILSKVCTALSQLTTGNTSNTPVRRMCQYLQAAFYYDILNPQDTKPKSVFERAIACLGFIENSKNLPVPLVYSKKQELLKTLIDNTSIPGPDIKSYVISNKETLFALVRAEEGLCANSFYAVFGNILKTNGVTIDIFMKVYKAFKFIFVECRVAAVPGKLCKEISKTLDWIANQITKQFMKEQKKFDIKLAGAQLQEIANNAGEQKRKQIETQILTHAKLLPLF